MPRTPDAGAGDAPLEDITMTVTQASQPTYAGVRVGVVLAGLREGIPTARLDLRSEEEGRLVDLTEGESADLFGRGTVTLEKVIPRPTAEERDRVTLTFRGGHS
jgi:hypothetical protein